MPQLPWRSVSASGNSPMADNSSTNASGHCPNVSAGRRWSERMWPGLNWDNEHARHAILEPSAYIHQSSWSIQFRVHKAYGHHGVGPF
eukprot:1810220-Lingulodinium_polyedra.AAC.1